MVTRTTVAIDDTLRKRIKKLSALLDLSQGEIIAKAIAEYERVVFSGIRQNVKIAKNENNDDNSMKNINDIFASATRDIWESDPETKEIQQKLLSMPGTIDDYILDSWDSGIES